MATNKLIEYREGFPREVKSLVPEAPTTPELGPTRERAAEIRRREEINNMEGGYWAPDSDEMRWGAGRYTDAKPTGEYFLTPEEKRETLRIAEGWPFFETGKTHRRDQSTGEIVSQMGGGSEGETNRKNITDSQQTQGGKESKSKVNNIGEPKTFQQLLDSGKYDKRLKSASYEELRNILHARQDKDTFNALRSRYNELMKNDKKFAERMRREAGVAEDTRLNNALGLGEGIRYSNRDVTRQKLMERMNTDEAMQTQGWKDFANKQKSLGEAARSLQRAKEEGSNSSVEQARAAFNSELSKAKEAYVDELMQSYDQNRPNDYLDRVAEENTRNAIAAVQDRERRMAQAEQAGQGLNRAMNNAATNNPSWAPQPWGGDLGAAENARLDAGQGSLYERNRRQEELQRQEDLKMQREKYAAMRGQQEQPTRSEQLARDKFQYGKTQDAREARAEAQEMMNASAEKRNSYIQKVTNPNNLGAAVGAYRWVASRRENSSGLEEMAKSMVKAEEQLQDLDAVMSGDKGPDMFEGMKWYDDRSGSWQKAVRGQRDKLMSLQARARSRLATELNKEWT